jgi:hypothetical protein
MKGRCAGSALFRVRKGGCAPARIESQRAGRPAESLRFAGETVVVCRHFGPLATLFGRWRRRCRCWPDSESGRQVPK